MKHILLLSIIMLFAVANSNAVNTRYHYESELIDINSENYLLLDQNLASDFNLLSQDEKEKKMSLYPNPTRNQFSLKGNISYTRIEVINAAGSAVKKFDKEDSNIYTIRDLQNGIYFVVLFDQNSKKKILKLIKK